MSGGPDSLCLLHVMQCLMPELGFALHVAHLNHGLRGAESDADEALVAETARAWGLPYTVEHADVARLAAQPGLSLEEAARNARYGFLAGLARRLEAAAVAVGHNADDQAETVLMHFLRGSGLAGLRGMLPVTDHLTIDGAPAPLTLIRPLLFTARADILAYCREHDLRPRFDRSNEDRTFYRNRLRHELLPLLETYNPQIRRVLAATASVAAADYDLLHSHTLETFDALAQPAADGAILFDLVAWRDLPLALQRSLLRKAVQRLRGGLRNISFVHIEQAVWTLREGNAGARITLPAGLEAVLGYTRFAVGEAGVVIPVDRAPQLVVWPVRLADRAALASALPGWQVETHLLSAAALPAGWQDNRDRWQAWLDADVAGQAPLLRGRRAGDRFQPLGMAGSEKPLAEFFTNAKVPVTARVGWPLLVNAADQILWVCGLRIDERARVTAKTTRVLAVRLQQKA
ncbi:MAG: tRNA lysidine(34) synthetase TilS [Caldilineales bacterium]